MRRMMNRCESRWIADEIEKLDFDRRFRQMWIYFCIIKAEK